MRWLAFCRLRWQRVISIEVERRAAIFASIAWMEACAGRILAKNQRRCQVDLSMTSTHYETDVFQLAQCALTSATLFSSLQQRCAACCSRSRRNRRRCSSRCPSNMPTLFSLARFSTRLNGPVRRSMSDDARVSAKKRFVTRASAPSIKKSLAWALYS